MAHFQLLTERGAYQTHLGGTGAETILIEQGKGATLDVVGTGNSSAAIVQIVLPPGASGFSGIADFMARVATGAAAGPDVVSVSRAGRRVTLTGLRPGTCVLIVGGTGFLRVQVGKFRDHAGLEHDLIAKVFRSADAEKMHELSRMLFNDADNLFNENSGRNINRWGHLACGTVSKVGGAAVFHSKLEYDYKEYYTVPIGGKTRNDIKIDSAKLARGRTAIGSRLARSIPSIVGLIYAPSAIQRGRVNVTGTGGHTVLIVGCSSDLKKFLYIDVWQGGSKLKYTGGYAGTTLFPHECECLGMFEMKHDAARGDILRSTTPGPDPVFNDPQFLEVVAGPLT
jgi:hypothetical protein